MSMQPSTALKNIFTSDFLSKSTTGESMLKDDIEKYIHTHQFNIERKPIEDSHLFFYNGIPIGSRGNILAITGKAKSRKTVVASAISTSAFIKDSFLGFTAEVNSHDNILHIDTEQGYYHYYGSVMRIFRDARIKGVPPNFHSIHTRDATTEMRIEILEYLFERLKPRVAIIDGVTDFVRDINDQDEATKMGEILLRLSYKYDALIIVVIHTTKTTGYMTGALGTHLEKKAQTVIKVEKDENNEEVSLISCQYARDKGFKNFAIKYDDELGQYAITAETSVITKGPKGDKNPEAYSADVHHSIINRLFIYQQAIPDSEIQPKILRAVKSITGDYLTSSQTRKLINYYNDQAWMFMNPQSYWVRPGGGTNTETQQLNFNDETTDELPF